MKIWLVGLFFISSIAFGQTATAVVQPVNPPITGATAGAIVCSPAATTLGNCPSTSGNGVVVVASGTPNVVSGTSSNCVLVNGTSAPCDAPGQGAVSSVTPVTATNPSSASALQQLTLTAGLLNIAGNSGGTFNYQAAGIYTVASLQTPALTWTLHACAVSACASGTDRTLFSIVTPSVVTATNNIWIIRAKIANTATGASGTLFAHGTATIELTAASDLGTPSNDSNTTSTAAIDLTGVVYLQLYVAASSSNAGNTVTNDQSSLEPASAIGPTGATGATGINSGVVFQGVPNVSITGMGTTYVAYSGLVGFGPAGEASVPCAAPFSGTISNLFFNSSFAATGGNYAITLRKNGVSQTLTCSVAASANSCSDITHTVSVSQGDLIDWQYSVVSGSPTATGANLSINSTFK